VVPELLGGEMRFLDLSITIDNDVVGDPPLARPKIEYVDHTQTFDRIRSFFPDLVPSDLPDS